MIVFMTAAEYTAYQNMIESGMDEDLAFQQLIRWTQADLQVETQAGDISEQAEVVEEQPEQPEEETTVEQISQE